MKTCTRCGANAYVDADPYCEHAYYKPPEPSFVREATSAGEVVYAAGGPIGGAERVYAHPTRDAAIALWQERALWGPAIAGLLRWLCDPSIRARAALDALGRDGIAVVDAGVAASEEFRRGFDAQREALSLILDRLGEDTTVRFDAPMNGGAVLYEATVSEGWYELRSGRLRAGGDSYVGFVTALRKALAGHDPFEVAR